MASLFRSSLVVSCVALIGCGGTQVAEDRLEALNQSLAAAQRDDHTFAAKAAAFYLKGATTDDPSYDNAARLLAKSLEEVGLTYAASIHFADIAKERRDPEYVPDALRGIERIVRSAAHDHELLIKGFIASGEKALAAEAEDLFPGIETVSVKRGTRRSRGDECSEEEYRAHSQGAVHMHPQNARKKIRTGACQALKRATKDKSFGLVPMKGPYSRTHVIRHHEGDLRRMYDVVEHSNHFAGVLNLSNDNLRPVESDEHLCELLVG